MMFDGSFELAVNRSLAKEGRTCNYSVRRSELIEILCDFNKADSLIMAKQFLKSQEENLFEGEG
jgi:hypothetical protein